MNILKALKSEEKKLKRAAATAASNLRTLRSTIKFFGNSPDKRRRKMSAAARAKISAAQKLRWSKQRKKN